MDHSGQIQGGGQESGATWTPVVCQLTDHTVSFTVNGLEVVSLPRGNVRFEQEGEVYRVLGGDELIFFVPDHPESFPVGLGGAQVDRGPDRSRGRDGGGDDSPIPTSDCRGHAIRASTEVEDRCRLARHLHGGFGVHKFYLNQTGMGVLYLVFFWTAIPALVGFIERIIYLFMSDEAFARQYG